MVETFLHILFEILNMYYVSSFFSLSDIDDPLLMIFEDSRSHSHDVLQCLWIVDVIDQVFLIRELLA
jgi:hypothetical protein